MRDVRQSVVRPFVGLSSPVSRAFQAESAAAATVTRREIDDPPRPPFPRGSGVGAGRGVVDMRVSERWRKKKDTRRG